MDGCLLEAGCYFIGWQLPTHCSRQTEAWKAVKGRGEHFLYKGVKEAHPDILDKAWERLKREEGEMDRDGWTVVQMEGFLKCDLVKKTEKPMPSFHFGFFSFMCRYPLPKCVPFIGLNISNYGTKNKSFFFKTHLVSVPLNRCWWTGCYGLPSSLGAFLCNTAHRSPPPMAALFWQCAGTLWRHLTKWWCPNPNFRVRTRRTRNSCIFGEVPLHPQH